METTALLNEVAHPGEIKIASKNRLFLIKFLIELKTNI